MLKLEMKAFGGETTQGAAERRALTVIARVPYGESTFKRNRTSFVVLMVLGGGGGRVALSSGNMRNFCSFDHSVCLSSFSFFD